MTKTKPAYRIGNNMKQNYAPIVKATYRAKSFTGSSLEITAVDIDGRVGQMVVWMLAHPEQAMTLFDDFLKHKEHHEAEGSAKNQGLEP